MKPKGVLTISNFSDISGNEWFAGYLARAIDLGIMEGYSNDNTIRPGQIINRAEAFKMVFSLLDKSLVSQDSDPWFVKYQNYAKENFTLSFLDHGSMADDLTRLETLELLSAVRAKQFGLRH